MNYLPDKNDIPLTEDQDKLPFSLITLFTNCVFVVTVRIPVKDNLQYLSLPTKPMLILCFFDGCPGPMALFKKKIRVVAYCVFMLTVRNL